MEVRHQNYLLEDPVRKQRMAPLRDSIDEVFSRVNGHRYHVDDFWPTDTNRGFIIAKWTQAPSGRNLEHQLAAFKGAFNQGEKMRDVSSAKIDKLSCGVVLIVDNDAFKIASGETGRSISLVTPDQGDEILIKNVKSSVEDPIVISGQVVIEGEPPYHQQFNPGLSIDSPSNNEVMYFRGKGIRLERL